MQAEGIVAGTRLEVDGTNHHLYQRVDEGAETLVSHMTQHVTPQIQAMNKLPVIYSLKRENNCTLLYILCDILYNIIKILHSLHRKHCHRIL